VVNVTNSKYGEYFLYSSNSITVTILKLQVWE